MTASEDASDAGNRSEPGRRLVIAALGLTQILAWGSSYYLPAVLAQPIAADTGWPLAWIVGGLSLGLLAAGIVAPRVGSTIDRHGGRPVLALSSSLLAVGLAALALAQSLAVYLGAWLLLGLGMGAGLYDAAFATLGRLYGQGARGAITTLTLYGGFASTLCWPLSAVLVEHVGWRGTCGVYAALQLLVALPIHLVILPRAPARDARAGPAPRGMAAGRAPSLLAREHRLAFVLLAAVLTLAAAISSLIAVHLVTILQARGLDLAAAVGLGALIGPAQVGARVVEMAFGRRYHPIWTMMASVALVAAGLALLIVGFPILAAALVLYGAGNGIGSIAKGTLPLALFGPSHYASLMGRLALPSLMAQALSPSVGAVILDRGGSGATLTILTGVALANVALAAALWAVSAAATKPLRKS